MEFLVDYTVDQLEKLVDQFGKELQWISLQLIYIYSWLRFTQPELTELQAKLGARRELIDWFSVELKGSIRKADHIIEYEKEATKYRFAYANLYHGAAWLKLDTDSKKRAGEDLNLLVLLEGSSNVGWLVPTDYIVTEYGTYPAPKVKFDLQQWRKGRSQRYVLFEGDENPPESDIRLDTPIKNLCTLLGVHVEDLERSVSNLMLCCAEKPWVPIRYGLDKETFEVGMSIPLNIRDRIVNSGLGVDLKLKPELRCITG